jgi:biopolymer transport protein ExbD
MKLARPNHFAPRAGARNDMNVTPFIDVLLVLLVMLILAIPQPVHVTAVDLPSEPKTLLPVRATNTIVITDTDALLWNGAEVTPEQLGAQVAAASAMEEEPVLRFEPAALASYDRASRTIALINDNGASAFTFAGLSQYRALD